MISNSKKTNSLLQKLFFWKKKFIAPSHPSLSATAEDIISNERENFRNLFRLTPKMICVLSGPDHIFEFVNEAHIKALGFDATGQKVRDAQPESVEIHGILDEVYTTGKTAYLQEIPVTLTDRLRYFDLTYAARRDLNGNINGVMVLGAEVTEKVLTRMHMENQQKWTESVLNQIPTALFVINPKSNDITFSNDAAKNMIGFETRGMAPAERYKAGVVKVYDKAGNIVDVKDIPSARAARGENMNSEEISLDTPAGKFHVAASSRIIPAEHGHPAQALMTFQDISKTKNVEAALRKSEEQLSMAINVSKIGFYDWDIIKDEITFSNQMKKDWGIEQGEIGKLENAAKLIHPDDRERVMALVDTSIQNGTPYHTEYRVIRPDGSVIWLEVRGQIIFKDKTPIRFVGTSVNIDNRKIEEVAIAQAKEAAEAANAAKSSFLANMSHEIRTPLGAIMGFTDLLAQPGVSQEESETFISIINRNSTQLLRIIDDILDLSKVEAGKMSIENVDFSLPETLADFSSMIGLRARENAIEFHMNATTQLPERISSDPVRLKQILLNIVGNAIKFTRKGRVDLIVSFEEGLLKFIVKDTGRGISEEQIQKLFQPFSQADDSTTRKFGGTGLGLVLTKKLCMLLGGDLVLTSSELKKGSTFEITVQVEVPPTSKIINTSKVQFSSETSKTNDEKPFADMKILLVEDSPDNQALFKIVLSKTGASIDIASDGSEGVELAKKKDYSLILMDVQMPKMDGHVATKTLRKEGYTLPIIALTAHAMPEERARCVESGFTDFLTKPLKRDSLYEVLEKSRTNYKN